MAVNPLNAWWLTAIPKHSSFLLNPKGNPIKPKSSLVALAVTAFALINAPAALAASSHDHSPKHGGIVAEGKAFDAELVAKPDLITVHFSDHGKPMMTKGAKGKITMLTGAEKTEVKMMPAGDSRMEAKGKFNVSAGTKAVVEMTPEGEKAEHVAIRD